MNFIKLPRLYVIIDAQFFPKTEQLLEFADHLLEGGVTLLQCRNKAGNARQILDDSLKLKERVGGLARLVMNDRSDLCIAAGFDGVHVGQDDLLPESARVIIGAERWLGVSTHNPAQLAEADKTSADYLAIGPVFSTSSKARPDPVIGVDGVRAARALTAKPLVAIGGINRANCRSVIEAGADAVAVIADLLNDPRESAEEFFRILR